MVQEQKQICKACALGNEKYPHNGDYKTCIKGRLEYIKHLPPEEQLTELIIHERISPEMAEFIFLLTKERDKTPFELFQEECLNLLNE
jgi:hypothetical protein